VRSVVATPFTPTLDSGRARRTYGIVRALAEHGRVDVVFGAFGAAGPDSAYRGLRGVQLHRVERPPAATRLPAYARARAAGVPGELARGVWPGLGSETARLAAEDTGARVVADGPVAAAALLGLARRRAVVYSAHNLESGFRHRLSESRLTRSGLERFERRLLQRFHESWMVSEADLRGARELEPAARLRLVPNVVDVAAVEVLPPRSGQRGVLFLADMRYEPNRIAARFLLEDVMPHVWTAAPEVTLTVAGIGSDELSHPDPRVTFAGFVDEVGPLYAAAGCAAVPLLEGGGSPLKFVEALAHGIPVVATARAAAGLTAKPGVEYFEGGDDGGSFAAALLRALEPRPAGAVATAGRRLAEREYSIEALARLLA
jgi:glycosyltransferase involved in cell wall biosynthesis